MVVETVISPLVESLFPSFYKEEGENFVAFTKAYYEWLEQSNNVINHSRSLLNYRDVDTTPEDFIIHFKEKYLKNIEFDIHSNKRLLLKHSLDIYRSKGTDRSIDLLFKLLYGTGAEVYRPGNDIFRVSDGEWTRPKYIEISNSPRTVDLVGKQITGVTSGATAFVEKYVKRRVKENYVYLLYISNVQGTFAKREVLRANTVYQDLPFVVGSLSEIEILTGGSGFSVGDVVSVVSESGDYGLARIAETVRVSGIVDFLFIDGGYGYTNAPSIKVSNVVLSLANVIANTTDTFDQFEVVREPITNISYSGGAGTFNEGDAVFSVSGAGVGRLMVANSNGATGTLTISRESGSFNATDVVYVTDNTANGTIATSSNADITGLVTQIPEQVDLIMETNTGFFLQHRVYQNTVSSDETANGVLTHISNTIFTVSNVVGSFVTGSPLRVRSGTNTGNVSSIAMRVALHDVSGLFSTSSQPIVYGEASGPTGRLLAISAGEDAIFDIGSIKDTEIVYINPEQVGSNNHNNQPFLQMPINQSQYYFTSNLTANLSSIIWAALKWNVLTIGEIETLANINPGDGYTNAPEVVIQEPLISMFDRKDYKFYLSNAAFSFTTGEEITQTNSVDFWDLTLTANGGWSIGEHVYTSTGNGNVRSIAGQIMNVGNVQGTFANSQVLHNLVDTTNTVITLASFTPQDVIAVANVVTANTLIARVARRQFDDNFVEGGPLLIGTQSGATAVLAHKDVWGNSIPIGLNANVEANVITSNGQATVLGIQDSGFAYRANSFVSFTGQEASGTGRVSTSAVGLGRGYYKTTKGFLSNDKFLFDGDYYQEYSYEILARLPFDKYSKVLDKVLHVAGSKAFGSVILKSFANAFAISATSEITVS